MTDPAWDPSGAVDDALRSIVSEYGLSVLSSPAELGPHLRDRLPDSPKQVALILGAAESEVAVSLREHLDQGMERDVAAQLAAATLIERPRSTRRGAGGSPGNSPTRSKPRVREPIMLLSR
jgi:hypothetical protein